LRFRIITKKHGLIALKPKLLMQASNLENYSKKCREDREYQEDLKDAITLASNKLEVTTIAISRRKDLKDAINDASSELGVTTITVSWWKIFLTIILAILMLVLLIITYKTGKSMLEKHF